MSPVQREDLQHLTAVFINSGWGGCTMYTSKGLPLERSPDGFQIVELTSPGWPVENWPGRMGIRVWIIIEDRMEGTGDQQQLYMEKRQFCVDIPSKKSFLVLDREEGVVGIASLEKNTYEWMKPIGRGPWQEVKLISKKHPLVLTHQDHDQPQR